MGRPPSSRPPRRRSAGALVVVVLLPALAGCMGAFSPPLLLATSLLRPTWQRIGCPPLARLDGSQTPEQLYRGAAACVRGSDPDTAVVLFSLAAAYGRYDTLRVADPTAHQAASLLRLVALQQLSDSQRQALSTGIAAALSKSGRQSDLCAAIERIGPPTYRPDYMLNHGQTALRRSLAEARSLSSEPSPGLVPDFDADAAWNQVLDGFLRCSKA